MAEGNVIITGSGAPGTNVKRPDGSQPVIGDIYFDAKNGGVYTAIDAGNGAIAWTYDLNVVGPPGVPFNEILSGPEDPTASTARPDGTGIVTGDFYLNGTSGDLFRASVNSATKAVSWAKVGNVRGPAGPEVDTSGLVKCTPPAQYAATANFLGYNGNSDQIVVRRADSTGGINNDGWYGLAAAFGGIKAIGFDNQGPFLVYVDGSKHHINMVD